MITKKRLKEQGIFYKQILIPLFILLLVTGGKGFAQRGNQILVNGTVLSTSGKLPLAGATVTVYPGELNVKTDNAGRFEIPLRTDSGTIMVTFLGYDEFIQPFSGSDHGPFEIILTETANQIEEVLVNTGYQSIRNERSTGSFNVIGNNLINRSVSTDILSRLENLSPGLLFNHGDAASTDPFLVRGRSTITAEAQPLIVLDDFPYDGDLNNINPNDIESVSILKDAAAASIWGARAGNGVIVLTSKRGTSTTPKLNISSNINFQGRPNLFNVDVISSVDLLDFTKLLFDNGQFDSANSGSLTGNTTPIPGAVELLLENPHNLNEIWDNLGKQDVRNDITKYLYRPSVNQQHSINISSSNENLDYYLSGGYDRNLSNLVACADNRISLRSRANFKINQRFHIASTLSFIQSNQKEGHNGGTELRAIGAQKLSYSPYDRLVDDRGNPMPIYAGLREGYIDTAGGGNLLDWTYRPIDEIYKERHSRKANDFILNLSAKYELFAGLTAEVKYQHENQLVSNENLYKENSFYSRHQTNRFTQIDEENSNIFRPFPAGAVLINDKHDVTSNQGRLQLSFNSSFNYDHEVHGFAGYEIRSKKISTKTYSPYYGYNEDYGAVNSHMNFNDLFPVYHNASSARISNAQLMTQLTDNFLSYFANGTYSFKKKYIVNASIRKDEANLFGVETNMKGTPLWSLGGAWQLDQEDFYKLKWLQSVKLRLTYGVNGNISRSASAFSTASFTTGSSHPLPAGTISSPPNNNLRWEKVRMLNVGSDFVVGAAGNIVVSIDYYNKDSRDLIALTPIDPTLGFTSVYTNVAEMLGNGVDVQVKSTNLKVNDFEWSTLFNYSHNNSKVSKYLMPVSSAGRVYIAEGAVNPIQGKPLYSVYSFKWAGLDPENGDPRGYLDGLISTDYASLYNGTPLEELRFHGPLQPTHYGAIMNTFRWKQVALSFNVSFGFGNYFRSQTISNTALLSGWTSHGDYRKRWQYPGDEAKTHVPAIILSPNLNRDNFYRYAEVHVNKADNIRLEDLSFSYEIRSRSSTIKSLKAFLYISNLGVLWTANELGVDPYYNNVPLDRHKVALGLNLTL